MLINLIYSLVYLILTSILTIKCQQESNHTIIELNKQYNGSITSDYSYAYFKLIIPEGVEKNSKNLVFKVREPDSAMKGIDDFSDPDIYVSTVNKYPKNGYESEFYSEKYGEDLLSIPNSKVFSGQIFYFSIFCEKKCTYQFTANLEMEWTIMENNIYTFYLKKDSSISLRFDQLRETFEELEFIAYSPIMSSFRIFISNMNNPSSSNSMTIIPSWIGGYFASVTKNSVFFCKNCTYNILVESDSDMAEVFFTVKYEDSVSKVNSQEPIFSTLKPFQKHCYSIEVNEKNKDDDIIVQTELFSGSANLQINPWENPRNLTTYKISKDISMEDVTLIQPQDRNNSTNNIGSVYVCLKSYDFTSYLMKIYFASQTQFLQKFNFLFTGVTVNGYLPKETVTRHRVTEFTSDADIFFKMQVFSGTPQLYGYICEDARKCFFTKESLRIIQQNLTNSEKTSDGYKLTIPNSQNFCHSKLRKEDSIKNEVETIPCAVFAIVYCVGEEPCIYNIQTTHTNSITKLRERKPHYQIVAYNNTDTYKLLIQNEKVENITIILNSITGDADMTVEGVNNTYKSSSYNEGYAPDVITISKSNIPESKNLLGEYLIKVKGATFASYSLLYYTHENFDDNGNSDSNNKEENKKPIFSNIIQLETGQIIRDFVMEYKNTTNYKIYSYNPKILPTQEGMDIRISLTPEHSDYKIYVLFDIDNLKLNLTENAYDTVENYVWVSNYSNEIIIKKDHPQYQKDKTYYIIVVPRYTYNDFDKINNTDPNSSNSNTVNNQPSSLYLNSFYYLGVTNEFYPFVLQEGFPSIITLDSNYTSQSFWYYHYNISNPVAMSINLFFGRVDVFVDFKWHEDITTSKTAIKMLDTDTIYFTIPPEKLKENSGNFPSVPLYIFIRKTSLMDAQFLLSIKSDVNKPESLKAGLVRRDSIMSGEYKYFFLNIRKGQVGLFNLNFRFGYGDVYFNVYDSTDLKNLNKYPNTTNFMYKSNDNYLGKSFSFNSDIINKCQSGSCRVLISVYGTNLGSSEDKIEYSISYYQDALTINQNEPFKSEVGEGEMKFFRVYFPKNIQNAYFSLTGMGSGDADLYVNYGDDFPSLSKYIWSSTTPNSEFVEFNKDDNFFVSNNKVDISGNYTIMVYGFSKTTFTLYITAHPHKIITLGENTAASCYTKKENDYCYFRFDNVYQNMETSTNNSTNKDFNLIMDTDFIYGSGVIYAKLYDGSDYDILRDFPNEHVYDFSNVNSNTRNILRINVKEDNIKYNNNSTILITVKCNEKCFLDLTATKLYNSTIKYLDSDRENLYYMAKSNDNNNKIWFVYFIYKQADLEILTKALEGKSNIKIYRTVPDESSENFSFNLKELVNYESSYPEKEYVYKSIKSQDLKMYESLYFEINPILDYTFSLRLTYKHDWNKIKLGVPNVFKLDADQSTFYGFFHMHDVFENVLLTISLNQKNVYIYCYVKYILYDKSAENSNQDKSTFDRIPAENDNDFSANSENLMNLVTIRLPKISEEDLLDKKTNKKKLVKVIFSIKVFESYNPNASTDSISNSINSNNRQISIMATPEVNNISKSAIPQKTLYYSLLNGFEKERNSTIQIYDLKRRDKEDDTLVVEISSCKGAVDMMISKKILSNIEDADKVRMIPSNIESSNGRTVYKFSNINENNFYMMLNGKKIPDFNCRPAKKDKANDFNNCNSNFTNVLVYYYTTKASEENKETIIPRESIIYEVVGSDTIRLKWTPLIEFSKEGLNDKDKIKLSNATYHIYVSNSINDYAYMDSVCYLNHMNSTDIKWEISENSKEAKIYGMRPNKKYFINILARKLDNSDVIAYKTIEVILEKTGPSMFIIIIFSIAFIVLIILVWYFYRRYKLTKQILNYEVNDIRNLSHIPVSESEMSEMRRKSDQKKYQNLTEDTSAV